MRAKRLNEWDNASCQGTVIQGSFKLRRLQVSKTLPARPNLIRQKPFVKRRKIATRYRTGLLVYYGTSNYQHTSSSCSLCGNRTHQPTT